MNDWGLALAIGLAAAVVSEITILMAVILPKFPLERGKTWRGTLGGVTTVSLVIGGVAGYIAGQFGGRGGGGSLASGPLASSTAPVTSAPATILATQPQPKPTSPGKEEPALAERVDLYFIREAGKTVAASFQCNLVSYRRQGSDWRPQAVTIREQSLDQFFPAVLAKLEALAKEMKPAELAQRRVRVFLEPYPGEGVYEQIKRRAEAAGWKVDRLNTAWSLEKPSS
jgi:hypothetical protein